MEFFVYTMSDPAPFCGDGDTEYRKGKDADAVLARVIKSYDHPAGLHYAAIYESADAYHKGKKPVAKYEHKCKFK